MNRGTALPLLLWESVRKPTFIPAFYKERGGMINHKGLLPKRAYRGRKQRFSTLIFTVYRPLGTVTGTGNHFYPETLLAVVGAGLTELVVLPPAIASQEERPFQTPFLTSAHREPCSGAPFSGCFASGAFRPAHSFFAASSRSRMEGLPWGSSRRPLLITPSIIP